jgi:predicted Zn-dependent protease
MTRPTIRPWARLPFVGLALLLALAACATSPATGRQFFTGGLSPQDEVRLGRDEHPKVVAEFGGAYDNPRLNAYVTSLGRFVARTSELPNLDYTFTILDSPTVNAFALPGGYVYVTRGLLALAGSEAELAGVLAHEIGHITSRHTAERYGSSVMATAAAIGVGALLGGTSGQTAAGALNLALLSYSRDQELEADTLGVRYLARTGHDTRAMAGFLQKLQAHSELEATLQGRPGQADAFNIMSTHPRTLDRIELAVRQAGVRPAADPIIGRDVYLDQIDGLLYGDSPNHGFARGNRFAHPKLGFAFEVPPDFRLINEPDKVSAGNPEGARIIFDRADKPSRASMTDYLAREWAYGVDLRGLEPLTVNGMEAATAWSRYDTGAGPRDLRLIAIRMDRDSIYRFIFSTPAELTSGLSTALRRTTYSFRRLGPWEAGELRPYSIRIHRVRSGETAGRLARRMPLADDPLRQFLVLNGLAEGEPLRAGDRVKLVTE